MNPNHVQQAEALDGDSTTQPCKSAMKSCASYPSGKVKGQRGDTSYALDVLTLPFAFRVYQKPVSRRLISKNVP
jgi:hypothetical protein